MWDDGEKIEQDRLFIQEVEKRNERQCGKKKKSDWGQLKAPTKWHSF